MRLAVLGCGLAADFGDVEALRRVKDATTDSPPPTDTSALSALYSARELRRIDHFTRMCLLAAHRAMRDAGNQAADDETAIVLASGYGPARTTFDFLDSMIDFGEACASPLAFSHSVHNIPAATVGIMLGLACPCMSLCQMVSPVGAGLTAAWTWLAEERARQVLFIAADERTALLADVLKRLGPEGRTTPRPGDGAAAFVLELNSGGVALQVNQTSAAVCSEIRNRSVYGLIPVGAAFDLATAVARVRSDGGRYLVRDGGSYDFLMECGDAT